MSGIITKMRQQPAWIALLIFVLLCLWIASGSLAADPENHSAKNAEVALPKVRTSTLHADQVNREITLYGRTEPDRVATLRAELKGQVTELFFTEGQQVKKGQKLVSIDTNDLIQRLNSAKASLRQREIELKGARSLGKQGYQSEANLAQAVANVESAKAEFESLQLALENTTIEAPFDGVINEQFVEIGDLLKDGDKIVTVVDLNPLVISADVTETHIGELTIGNKANGRMVTGKRVEGQIRFISSVSNMGTNTFKIEVEVDNTDQKLMAGMSTELSIPLEQTWAIKITPAVMSLDELGNLGVKTLVDNRVKFVPIDMIKSDSEGVWLAGLGQQSEVITLGHGFVRDGDQVEVVNAAQATQASK
jgi:multidrug efflux system membrane fusion protein